MLGHRDRHFGQVEDLAALNPGDRPTRQPSPAPAAAIRLMTQLPVRPGHLRQRRALMPVLPARLAAASLPQRPPRRRLIQPLAGRRPRRIARRPSQPRLKLPDPLPGLRQLLSRPRQRRLRPGQLLPQRRHQRSQDLIPGTSVIAKHTGTLLPHQTAHAAIPHHRRISPTPAELRHDPKDLTSYVSSSACGRPSP